MIRSEIPVFGSNILKLPGCWVNDLDIARDIPLPVDFAELIEGLVCYVGHVKLVVS